MGKCAYIKTQKPVKGFIDCYTYAVFTESGYLLKICITREEAENIKKEYMNN